MTRRNQDQGFPAHDYEKVQWRPASGRRPEIDAYLASIPRAASPPCSNR